MCSVDKMLIKGIRSFCPENDHAIVFPKPLTLIVGRNGAGKTVSARFSFHMLPSDRVFFFFILLFPLSPLLRWMGA